MCWHYFFLLKFVLFQGMSGKRDIILVAFLVTSPRYALIQIHIFITLWEHLTQIERLAPCPGHLWLPWTSWKPFLCPSRRGKLTAHRPFVCTVANTAFLTRHCVSSAVSADKTLSRVIYCLPKAVILARSIWRCVCSRLTEQTRCFGITLWLKIMVTCCNSFPIERRSQHTSGLLSRHTQMYLWSKSRSEPIICLALHRSMTSCTTKIGSVLPWDKSSCVQLRWPTFNYDL